MTKQYLVGQSVPRVEAEAKLRAIFSNEDIFVVGQGLKINFRIQNKAGFFGKATLHQWQIEALAKFNWKLIQVQAQENGLTIWVTEVDEWE